MVCRNTFLPVQVQTETKYITIAWNRNRIWSHKAGKEIKRENANHRRVMLGWLTSSVIILKIIKSKTRTIRLSPWYLFFPPSVQDISYFDMNLSGNRVNTGSNYIGTLMLRHSYLHRLDFQAWSRAFTWISYTGWTKTKCIGTPDFTAFC